MSWFLLLSCLFFTTAVAQTNCTIYQGQVIGANNIGEVIVANYSLCCNACNQNGACKAWTYDTSGTNACYLKDNTDDNSTNANRVSGLRSVPPPPPQPSVLCNEAPQSGYPYCNPNLSPEDRATDLVGRMTLSQKIQQTWSVAPGISSLGMNAYNWRANCLHGWSNSGVSWPSGVYWTVFPAPIGLGASWDPDLIKQIGQVTADEGRSLHNLMLSQEGGQTPEGASINCFSPNINLLRHPLWGRAQETYGEDPYLISQLGVGYTRGLQEGEDPKYVKIIACPKHYAVHSGPESDRLEYVASVTDHDLYDTFVAHFESNVRCAKAGQIMPAYTGLKCSGQPDGAPDCANPFLLIDLLRNDWNAPNISVMSDNGAVEDVDTTHHYVNSLEMAAAVTINATTDIDLGNDAVYPNYLPQAVSDGLVQEQTITNSVWRSMYWRIKTGDFDPASMVSYQSIGTDHLNTTSNQNLNVLSAQESLVLLKNINNTLPLTASSIKSIAIIGPQAFKVFNGNYAGNAAPQQNVPLSAGIAKYVSTSITKTSPGCSNTQCTSSSEIAAAVTAATGADLAILALGLDLTIENEGLDRVAYPCDGVYGDSLALPGCQDKLLTEVAAVAPVVVVLIHGGAVSISDAVNSNNVKGVIDAFYPGPRGGDAIASALFGDYNPGGRVPATVYTTSKDLPSLSNYDITTPPGFTYKWFTGPKVQYEFGFGLSYTTFTYSSLSVSPQSVAVCSNITISFSLRNSGTRTGDEVVQLYLITPKQSYGVPLRSLQGFKRIKGLAAGASTQVSFTVSPYNMHVVDNNGKRYVNPGTYTFYVGGHQPGNDLTGLLTGTFTVTGTSTIATSCPNSPITYSC